MCRFMSGLLPIAVIEVTHTRMYLHVHVYLYVWTSSNCGNKGNSNTSDNYMYCGPGLNTDTRCPWSEHRHEVSLV